MTVCLATAWAMALYARDQRAGEKALLPSPAMNAASTSGATPPAEGDALKVPAATSEHGAAGRTPLHKAALAGDIDRIGDLLARGADLNATDAAGRTPLYLAAWEGRSAVVEVLLRRGAARDLAAGDGTRAVDAARRGGHRVIVSLLAPPSPRARGKFRYFSLAHDVPALARIC